jgi:hypothetical protein
LWQIFGLVSKDEEDVERVADKLREKAEHCGVPDLGPKQMRDLLHDARKFYNCLVKLKEGQGSGTSVQSAQGSGESVT